MGAGSIKDSGNDLGTQRENKSWGTHIDEVFLSYVILWVFAYEIRNYLKKKDDLGYFRGGRHGILASSSYGGISHRPLNKRK